MNSQRIQKKFSEAECTHDNASCYTNTDGVLELSWQGKPVLRGACPPQDNSCGLFFGPPLAYVSEKDRLKRPHTL